MAALFVGAMFDLLKGNNCHYLETLLLTIVYVLLTRICIYLNMYVIVVISLSSGSQHKNAGLLIKTNHNEFHSVQHFYTKAINICSFCNFIHLNFFTAKICFCSEKYCWKLKLFLINSSYLK